MSRDSEREERRSIKSWASRLGVVDEPLTLKEAHAYAQIASTDRELDILTVLKDMQARLLRMEVFLALKVPGYDEHVREQLQKSLNGASPDVAAPIPRE